MTLTPEKQAEFMATGRACLETVKESFLKTGSFPGMVCLVLDGSQPDILIPFDGNSVEMKDQVSQHVRRLISELPIEAVCLASDSYKAHFANTVDGRARMRLKQLLQERDVTDDKFSGRLMDWFGRNEK